jgi:hypothetical protein
LSLTDVNPRSDAPHEIHGLSAPAVAAFASAARARLLSLQETPVCQDPDHGRLVTAAPLARRILFSFRSPGYLRFYESVIRLLAERGHTVHVLVDHGEGKRQEAANVSAMMALSARYPSVTFSWSPRQAGDLYAGLALWIRRCLDYLHFLRPQFDAAPILRERAASRAPRFLTWLGASRSRARTLIATGLELALHRIEPATTPPITLEQRIGPQVPDVIVVSPLITLGSAQFDLLRLARAAGIPTALGVASWDHLSAKVLISTIPDRVFVWNDTQRREAIEYHRIPADQVLVTGAQCFDQWFDRRPSETRSDFCRGVGLRDDRPFVLYVCSALFEGSPSEAAFVERWVRAIRSSPDDRLRSTPILIRPHPKRNFEWTDVDLSGFDNVAVWPPRGQMPIGAEGRSLYFDSLYYSTAVVGLNTSAMIEAGIIGRPVYTVLLPEFHDNQEGTLHFHYLLQVEGGLLHAARSLDDHLTQMADGLDDPASAVARNAGFVKAFVRPLGLDVPATRVFVDELERTAAPAAATTSVDGWRWWIPVMRTLLWPVAVVLRDKRHSAANLWRKEGVSQDPRADWRLATVLWRCRAVLRPWGRRWSRGELRKDRFWHLVRFRVRERARVVELEHERAGKLERRERQLQVQALRRTTHQAYKRRLAARARWRQRAVAVVSRLRPGPPPPSARA